MSLSWKALMLADRGLMARIAHELGITRAAVAMWQQVPAERVPEVSRISGIPRHVLRPDLWEAPACACEAA